MEEGLRSPATCMLRLCYGRPSRQSMKLEVTSIISISSRDSLMNRHRCLQLRTSGATSQTLRPCTAGFDVASTVFEVPIIVQPIDTVSARFKCA